MSRNRELKDMLRAVKEDAARPHRQALTMLVRARNTEETVEGYQAYDSAIDALLSHPALRHWREDTLNDLVDMSQEALQ